MTWIRLWLSRLFWWDRRIGTCDFETRDLHPEIHGFCMNWKESE